MRGRKGEINGACVACALRRPDDGGVSRLCCLVPLLGLLLAHPVRAQQTDALERTSALCVAAEGVAEKAHGIPPGLLLTISRVESGRPIHGRSEPWPWVIDSDGQAYYYDTKDQAVAAARSLLGKGARYTDIGCMQVDWQQHPGAFANLETAFDPAANADYAARFLRQLYDNESSHSWPTAVGFYHSHTPALAEAYRGKVAELGASILGGVAGPQSLYQRALRQGSLHMALAGGGLLVLNLNRQPAAPNHRPMSSCQVARVLGDYLRSPPKGGCGGVKP